MNTCAVRSILLGVNTCLCFNIFGSTHYGDYFPRKIKRHDISFFPLSNPGSGRRPASCDGLMQTI